MAIGGVGDAKVGYWVLLDGSYWRPLPRCHANSILWRNMPISDTTYMEQDQFGFCSL